MYTHVHMLGPPLPVVGALAHSWQLWLWAKAPMVVAPPDLVGRWGW
jgi:hypothetical protein